MGYVSVWEAAVSPETDATVNSRNPENSAPEGPHAPHEGFSDDWVFSLLHNYLNLDLQ